MLRFLRFLLFNPSSFLANIFDPCRDRPPDLPTTLIVEKLREAKPFTRRDTSSLQPSTKHQARDAVAPSTAFQPPPPIVPPGPIKAHAATQHESLITTGSSRL